MIINWANDQKLIAQLKQHEGIRLKLYTDTEGYLTIGIGRNLSQRGISLLEAELLCINDINIVQTELRDILPWIDTVHPTAQRVLVEMAFNLGVPKLLKFEKALGLLKAGHYEAAASEILNSKWAKQVGQRAITLHNQMRLK